MSTRPPSAVLGAALLLALSTAHAAEGLSFAAALQAAEATAPQLQARRATVTGAEDAASSADALPDPKIFIGIDNLPIDGADRFSTTHDFMTMQKIGVMQDFPGAGKRQARAEGAQAQVSLAQAQLQLARINVRIETATAWLNRYYLSRQQGLFSEFDQDNRLLGAVVKAQLATGRGMATDALLPRQESIALNNRRDELQRDIAKANAVLQRWLGDDAQRDLTGEPPRFVVDAATLRQHIAHHPELLLLQPLSAQASAELHEAEASRRPGWGIELAYQDRGSAYSNMMSFQVSMDLPLFAGTRQNPVIRSKQQALLGIEAERESMTREHRAILEAEVADYAALTQQLDRQRHEALSLAQDRVDLQMAAYRSGRADLTQVLQARRELRDIRLQAIALENQQQVLAARLHFLFENTEETAP
ncbi:MAG: TolC family protein [bacterium]|nr:TolC family protein [bacterium]